MKTTIVGDVGRELERTTIQVTKWEDDKRELEYRFRKRKWLKELEREFGRERENSHVEHELAW